jgi:probable phosphoglycerate mutase
MTATIFLVRHAAHGLLGKRLVGRMSGISLSEEGREQAERLAQRLARERLTAIHASPRERAQETAAPIGRATGLSVETVSALDEVDTGQWTGRSFDELKDDPRWKQWNEARLVARAPGGESMLEVQRRVIDHVEMARTRHGEARVAMVGHSDVIRAALLYYLGMSIDEFGRVEVSPASLSTLSIGDWGAKVVLLNETISA